MKKSFLLILFVFDFGLAFALPPEIDKDNYLDVQQEEMGNHFSEYKNIGKMNLSSLALTTFSFQYERIIGKKTSVSLGFRFTPSSSLPFKSIIKGFIEDEGDSDNEIHDLLDNTRKSGVAFTPEFRYYLGKKAGKGFYVAPFGRYEHLSLKAPFFYDNDEGQRTSLNGNISINSLGIGVLFGTQFRISERFTFDWWILGPYYTRHSVSISASNLNLSASEQRDLKEAINDIEVMGRKPDVTITANKLEAKDGFSFGAVRAFGFCLGFKF